MKYYSHFFILFIVDTALILVALVYSIHTSVQLFTFTQPDKISETIVENITKQINEVKNDIFENPFDSKRLLAKENRMIELIMMFINLTVIAVKAKDHETITANIKTIGDGIWVSIIRESMTEFEKDNLTRTDELFVEQIFSTTLDLRKKLNEQLVRVYKDIYESAFAAKEFFVCNEIIESLKGIRFEEVWVLQVFDELYELSLSYNYPGYTRDYCKKIATAVVEILSKQERKSYGSYFRLIRRAIEHKQASILSSALGEVKELISQELDINERRKIYRLLRDATIYSLWKKRMDCFATLIRFTVTSNLPLSEINQEFADFMPSKNLILYDVLKADLREQRQVFNFEVETQYYGLKCYFVFYSYYKLQERVSHERISENNRLMDVSLMVSRQIPFNMMRTLLLDLDTHIDHWDKLFISQASYYFVLTSSKLLEPLGIDLLREELIEFGTTELMIDLDRKIKTAT